MTIVINTRRARSLLHRAVETKGADHVQNICRNVEGYAPDLQPGCLIGTALNIAGVPLDTLARFDGSLLYSTGPDLAREGAVKFTAPALAMLYAAQKAQDGGATWGEAEQTALDSTLMDFHKAVRNEIRQVAKMDPEN